MSVREITSAERPLTKGVKITVVDLDNGEVIEEKVVKDDYVLFTHGRCFVSYTQTWGKSLQHTIRYDGKSK
jgi:hypothetical protein